MFSLLIQEKGLDFINNINSELPNKIYIDEIRLRQVIFNLIGNAIKFTSKGYVKLEINIENNNNNNINLIISVEDTGIGIPLDQQSLIFDAFKQQSGQSTRRFGGTGLGLTISKKLVNTMGGEITVESTVGKGSKFSVILKNIKYKEDKTKKLKNTQNIESKISSKKINQEQELTSQIIQDLQELHNLVKKIQEENLSEDIEQISKQLIKIGEKHNSDYVINIAKKLLASVENFDITKTEKLVEIISKLCTQK
jgi:phosphoglycerate-specific signal transduction histidine kinase